MEHSSKFTILTLLAAFSGVIAERNAYAQSFEFLVGPSSMPITRIRGLSADGSAAAGPLSNSTGGLGGFYWTRSGGLQTLQSFGVPDRFFAEGISGDGQVVVGAGPVNYGFRWSAAAGLQQLPAPTGYTGGYALATNNDGSVVGGRVQINPPFGAPPFYFATVWNAAGTPTVLDPTYSLGDSKVNAISGDGMTVVGGDNVAWSWTASGGIHVLPSIPNVPFDYGVAAGISNNGQFIVGLSNGRAARWHDGTVTELLSAAYNTGRFADASFVSNDGNVVGGAVYVSASIGYVPGVWTPSTQFIPLADYFAANGVQVPQGVILDQITGMSADGRTFAGTTRSADGTFGPYAWIATVPSPGAMSLGVVGGLLGLRRRRPSA